MKSVFIFNPESGNGKIKKYQDYIVSSISKKYGEITCVETDHAGHAYDYLKQNAGFFDYVFVAGGDGTLNEAVSGIMDSGACPTIGYIPTGTCNDVAHSLGISKNIKKAVKTLIEGTPSSHDIFSVNNKYGIYVCCAGLFSKSSYSTERRKKRFLGKIAYYIDGFKEIFNTKPIPVTLEYDSEKISTSASLLLILNSKSTAGFKLNKKASLNDGKVEVLIFHSRKKKIRFFDILKIAKAFVFGVSSVKKSKNVTYLKLSQFNIKTDDNISINIDGELGTKGSFDFKVLQNKIKIITPQKTASKEKDEKYIEPVSNTESELTDNKIDKTKNSKIEKSVNKNNLPTDELSRKKTFSLNTLLKPIIYFIFAIVLEVINFTFLSEYSKYVTFGSFPTYFLLDVGVILVLTGILYLVQNKIAQNIFFYIFLGFQILINIVNVSLLSKQGILFSLDLLNLLGEATLAFSWQFVDIPSLLSYIIILVFIICIQVIFDCLVKKKFVSKRVRKIPIFLSLFVAYSGIGFTSYYTQTKLLPENISFLYESKYSSVSLMNNFGTFGLIIDEISSLLFDSASEDYINEILEQAENGTTEVNTDAVLYGDNLIVLMLESFDSFAIDPYNTPTLYSLMQDGIYMTNFLSNNKTNISEIYTILGYQPSSLTLSLTSDNSLATKYSLPNLFGELGYSTNYFHNNLLTAIYNRDVNMDYLGFENVYGLEDAEIEGKTTTWNDWNREEDFLNSMIDLLAPNDGSQFFSFYLTVATHGSYAIHISGFDDCFEIYDNNLELLKEYWAQETSYIFPESEEDQQLLRELKARAIDTDNMIKDLLEYLNDTGLIENTTLIIYADHNAYYDDLAYTIKGTSSSDYSNMSSYTVPFIICSQKLGSYQIDDLCTTADIYATICDLFGLPYNTFFMQGRSIFNANIESFAWSYLTGYYSEKFYASNDLTIIQLDPNATDEDREEFEQRLLAYIYKQILLNKALIYNIQI